MCFSMDDLFASVYSESLEPENRAIEGNHRQIIQLNHHVMCKSGGHVFHLDIG